MALNFLGLLPSSPSPHPRLPFFSLSSPPKLTPLLHFSRSPYPINYNTRYKTAREINILFRQHFSSLAAQTTTEEEEEEEEEESKEIIDRKRLIAQNIPWTSTAQDIRTLFQKHGTVVDVQLSMYNSGRNRGLAFITMSSEEEASTALNSLESYDLDGRVIKVDYARPLKKNPPGPGVPGQKYTVYAGNLAWSVRTQDLRELFNAGGKVLSAEIIFQTNPRRPAGYGFVTFSSLKEAEAAISTLNGKNFMGRPLRAGLSKTRDPAKRLDEDGQSGDATSELKVIEEQSSELKVIEEQSSEQKGIEDMEEQSGQT